MHDLRPKLARDFPGVSFSFLPADIVSQILNFGLPAPIDIQIVGYNLDANREFALKLLDRIKYVDGITDLRIQQPFNQPKLHINVDRTKAEQVGYTQRDIASNLLISLSGSFQTSPDLLAESKKWSQLFDCHADAAVPHGFVAGPGKHSGDRWRRQWG